MARIHAVELEDLPGFPALWRDAGTAYLRFVAEATGQIGNMLPFIERALSRSGEHRIVDLCSGGGGPALAIAQELARTGRDVDISLTDLYPSKNLGRLVDALVEREGALIRLEPESIDATRVPAGREGLRTLFNAFHHFRPDAAAGILRSAVEARQPIAIIEVLQRGPLTTAAMLGSPLMVWLATPFLRPFHPAWLAFTYLLPVIPFFVMWDGLISSLRVYTPSELRDLLATADPDETFEWEIAEVPMRPAPVNGLSLIGIPRERLAA